MKVSQCARDAKSRTLSAIMTSDIYSDLQPLAQRASNVHILQTSLCSQNQTILGIVNGTTSSRPITGYTHPSHRGYQFSVQDLELLHKFHHTRTILTLGVGRGRHVYQHAYAKLTYSVCQVHSVFCSVVPNQKSASVLAAYCVDFDNDP